MAYTKVDEYLKSEYFTVEKSMLFCWGTAIDQQFNTTQTGEIGKNYLITRNLFKTMVLTWNPETEIKAFQMCWSRCSVIKLFSTSLDWYWWSDRWIISAVKRQKVQSKLNKKQSSRSDLICFNPTRKLNSAFIKESERTYRSMIPQRWLSSWIVRKLSCLSTSDGVVLIVFSAPTISFPGPRCWMWWRQHKCCPVWFERNDKKSNVNIY